MKWRGAGIAMFLLVAAAGVARGQVAVSIQLEQENLLLYEPIQATVTIRSSSGRPIDLTSTGDQSWLTFLVTDIGGRSVASTVEGMTEAPLSLDPGQRVQRTINLLPRYDLRTHGQYQVQAVVHGLGASIVSAPVRFTILHGTELWSDTAVLPETEPGREESRTYSLVAKRERTYDVLYVGVRDPAHDLVYGMIRLGPYLPMPLTRPLSDRQGRLHVLYRHDPRVITYICVDPQAQILDRVLYSDLASAPTLRMSDDGQVRVQGGTRVEPGQALPNRASSLTPAPVPPPKKKSWWQFWK